MTAQRLTQLIGRIPVFAAEGWRAMGDNPAERWTALAFELDDRESKEMAAFPCEDVPAFFAALRAEESVISRCLPFLFLVGRRSQQVRHLVWSELKDLDGGTS